MEKFIPHWRKTSWLIIGSLAVSLFALIYPVYVIRPFRHQGPGELALALIVLRFRAVAMAACILIALVAALRYRRLKSPRWRKIAAGVGVAGVGIFAVLSRVNIYEKMFHPMGAPSFESAGEAKLEKGEMIMAIQVNGVSRVYPVRSISYHHIVNDVVGGVPIAATY